MSILYPAYFPTIAFFTIFAQSDEIIWETQGNYQKQTFRNRTYICNDRGKHILSIPISHAGKSKGKQLNLDIKIDNTYPWQRQHWRTLETAYRTSPYFEFYEDDIKPLYDTEFEYLMDFNLKTIEIICECLQLEMPRTSTQAFKLDLENDYRHLVRVKNKFQLEQIDYVQVFGDRHGFTPNLSILDLLFNLGPNATTYLKETKLTSGNA
ncbi:MAG: hypothetical protein ACJART_001640 [Maribacter sp.]|jgi:hypothetical protein